MDTTTADSAREPLFVGVFDPTHRGRIGAIRLDTIVETKLDEPYPGDHCLTVRTTEDAWRLVAFGTLEYVLGEHDELLARIARYQPSWLEVPDTASLYDQLGAAVKRLTPEQQDAVRQVVADASDLATDGVAAIVEHAAQTDPPRCLRCDMLDDGSPATLERCPNPEPGQNMGHQWSDAAAFRGEPVAALTADDALRILGGMSREEQIAALSSGLPDAPEASVAVVDDPLLAMMEEAWATPYHYTDKRVDGGNRCVKCSKPLDQIRGVSGEHCTAVAPDAEIIDDPPPVGEPLGPAVRLKHRLNRRLHELLGITADPCENACVHVVYRQWTALGAANVLARADTPKRQWTEAEVDELLDGEGGPSLVDQAHDSDPVNLVGHIIRLADQVTRQREALGRYRDKIDYLAQQIDARVAERDEARGELYKLAAVLEQCRADLQAVTAERDELRACVAEPEPAQPVAEPPAVQSARAACERLGVPHVDGVPEIPNMWMVGMGAGGISFHAAPMDAPGTGTVRNLPAVDSYHALLLAAWLAVMADPMGDVFDAMLTAVRSS